MNHNPILNDNGMKALACLILYKAKETGVMLITDDELDAFTKLFKKDPHTLCVESAQGKGVTIQLVPTKRKGV